MRLSSSPFFYIRSVLFLHTGTNNPYRLTFAVGLALALDQLQSLAASRGNVHLVLESHVVVDCLPRGADVVGDLSGIKPFSESRENPCAAKTMDGGSYPIVRIHVPFVTALHLA